jgi:hypothetical protein
MALTRFRLAATGIWSGARLRARKADWLAVAGELAIVVFGILIAFQLDRWAEHWGRTEERQLFLRHLAEESAANTAELERRVDEFEATTGDVLRLSRAIAAPDRPGRADYGCGTLHLPASRLQTAALDEAADTRALAVLPDAELHRLSHAAAAANHFADRQLDYFRDAFQRFGDRLDRYTLWRIGADGERISCEVPLDRLAGDAEAVSLLTRIYRDRRRFSEILREQLAAQRALADRARCLRDGRC